MKRFGFLYVFILLFSISNAQNDWEILSPHPTLHTLEDVSFPTEQCGWAVGNNSIIMHTTDGGDTWDTQFDPGSGLLSGVFFLDTLQGWTVGWSYIYHTTDGGQSWNRQTKPNYSGDLIDVYFINSDIGWISGYYKILFKTTDGGEHWERLMSDLFQDKDFYSVYFTDTLHGCAVGGMVSGENRGLIMITNDGGETWEDKTPIDAPRSTAVEFLNADTGWVCGRDGQLLKTVDGGNTWIDHSFTNIEDYNDIHFFDDQHGVLLKNYEVRITEDGGDTWDSLVTIVNYNSRLLSFSSGANNHLFAVGRNGVMAKSVDGGSTWEKLSSGQDYSFSSMGFFDLSEGLAISGYWSSGSLFRTWDGGQSWEPDTIIEGGPFYKLTANDGNFFMLDHSSQLAKSVDNGATWELMDVPSLTSYYYDMFFVDSQSGYLCGDSSLLVKTTDGGESWEQILFDDYHKFISMYFHDENTGWIIDFTGKTILRTEDGGVSWDSSQLIYDEFVFEPQHIYFINEDIGYASTREGLLFKTVDGGESWSVSHTFFSSFNSRIKFVTADEGWYFASTKAYYTQDGGDSWTLSHNFDQRVQNSFFFSNGQGWLCGLYGLVAWHSAYVDIKETNEKTTVLQVFPNPATKSVNIELTDKTDNIGSVEIINMMGQRVMFVQASGKSGTYQMDVSALIPGTYMVKVISLKGERLAKLVIK